MTINKAQGQTLQRVGVLLDEPVFTHGQLYVAASRCAWRAQQHQVSCTELSDGKRRVFRSVVLLNADVLHCRGLQVVSR